ESSLLALVGGVLGVGVAYGGLRMLLAMVDPTALPVIGTIGIDSKTLGFSLALSLATGVFFGIAPAIQAVRHDLISGLKDGSKGSEGPGRQRVEGLLVVAQVAIALTLLAGALLFMRSFSNLVNADPGFDPAGVVALDVNLPETSFPDDETRWAFYEQFLSEIRAQPGVSSAAITLPLLGGWQSSFSIEGRPPAARGELPSADVARVSADYFTTLGIDILQGRAIDRRDTADGQRVAVIDRTMAEQFFADEDPIGQRLVLGREPSEDNPWLTIVGVAEHVKNYGVAEESRVELYMPMAQRSFGNATLVVETPLDMPEQVVAGIESALYELSAEVPIANVRTLEQLVQRTMVAERFLAGMLSAFAAVAILLAALGIYGVMAFFVAQRQKEIGIRMALGAARVQVVGLVALQGFRLTIAGIVLGYLVVLAGGPHLGAQLFQVAPRDPAVLVVLPLLLLLVSLFACTSPVRRASRIEPVEALRDE
ncbi:MAG: ABC transporter permease, partial [Holophagales bacterium]|nr:ABC transporter permease [Holophagales bacterium]